ncbi:MAG: hypothetical protein MUF49_27445 [Oculatellaceae cyanobacterium Prado106]|jgi:hypothetical protein|nr:hypothetical protein [Oculatellaceae cyanobacterium Prado106]
MPKRLFQAATITSILYLVVEIGTLKEAPSFTNTAIEIQHTETVLPLSSNGITR